VDRRWWRWCLGAVLVLDVGISWVASVVVILLSVLASSGMPSCRRRRFEAIRRWKLSEAAIVGVLFMVDMFLQSSVCVCAVMN